jgi:hypothetical protein
MFARDERHDREEALNEAVDVDIQICERTKSRMVEEKKIPSLSLNLKMCERV